MKSALAQQLVQADQADAELRGAGRLDVRVVGDQPGAERGDPLGEQHADPAEADHADGLAVRSRRRCTWTALPLAAAAARRRRPAMWRATREQQRDGVLGGGDDVGRRRVDHHARRARWRPAPRRCPARRPARATTFSRGAAAIASASTWVAQRTSSASASASAASSAGAVGAVDVADVEVVAEHVERGRGELLGDQDERDGQTASRRELQMAQLCADGASSSAIEADRPCGAPDVRDRTLPGMPGLYRHRDADRTPGRTQSGRTFESPDTAYDSRSVTRARRTRRPWRLPRRRPTRDSVNTRTVSSGPVCFELRMAM